MKKLEQSDFKEMGRRGGLASARARRMRRGLSETIMYMMNDPDAMKRQDLTAAERIACQLIQQAGEGNLKAAEFLRDTLGEKPGKAAPRETAQPPREIRIKVVE